MNMSGVTCKNMGKVLIIIITAWMTWASVSSKVYPNFGDDS